MVSNADFLPRLRRWGAVPFTDRDLTPGQPAGSNDLLELAAFGVEQNTSVHESCQQDLAGESGEVVEVMSYTQVR